MFTPRARPSKAGRDRSHGPIWVRSFARPERTCAQMANVGRFGAMAVYLCHESPDLYEHEATVVDAQPGRVVLDRSAFHPGGGGQVSDAGWLEYSGGVVP